MGNSSEILQYLRGSSEGKVIDVGVFAWAAGSVGAIAATTGFAVTGVLGSGITATLVSIASALVAVTAAVAAGIIGLVASTTQHLHFSHIHVKGESGSTVAPVILS